MSCRSVEPNDVRCEDMPFLAPATLIQTPECWGLRPFFPQLGPMSHPESSKQLLVVLVPVILSGGVPHPLVLGAHYRPRLCFLMLDRACRRGNPHFPVTFQLLGLGHVILLLKMNFSATEWDFKLPYTALMET